MLLDAARSRCHRSWRPTGAVPAPADADPALVAVPPGTKEAIHATAGSPPSHVPPRAPVAAPPCASGAPRTACPPRARARGGPSRRAAPASCQTPPPGARPEHGPHPLLAEALERASQEAVDLLPHLAPSATPPSRGHERVPPRTSPRLGACAAPPSSLGPSDPGAVLEGNLDAPHPAPNRSSAPGALAGIVGTTASRDPHRLQFA